MKVVKDVSAWKTADCRRNSKQWSINSNQRCPDGFEYRKDTDCNQMERKYLDAKPGGLVRQQTGRHDSTTCNSIPAASSASHSQLDLFDSSQRDQC